MVDEDTATIGEPKIITPAQAEAPGVDTGPTDAPLARQVGPSYPGAVEGPVFKDPNAPPLIDPAIAAQTPALAPPPPVAPVVVPPPPEAPPAMPTGKPTMAGAATALDQATRAGYDEANAQKDVGKAKSDEMEANAKVIDKQAEIEKQNAAEIATKTQAQEVGLQRAQQIASEAEDKYKNFTVHDFLNDKLQAEGIKAKLFIALGAYGASYNGGQNSALEKIKMQVDSDFHKQQAELGKLDNFAKMKREGVTQLSEQYKSDLAGVQLKHAAAYQAIATEAKAQAMRNGMTEQQAENTVLYKKLQAEALQHRAEGTEKLWNAQANISMAGAHLALERRAQDITVRGQDIVDRKKKDELDEKKRVDDAKVNADQDPKLAIRNPKTGEVLGYAATPRAVMEWNKTGVNYDQAIDSLKALLADKPTFPAGSKWHNAVLAIASTTTAGQTDANVKHEAGTLKNSIGLPDKDAITDKIADLENRKAGFIRDLTPIRQKPDASGAVGGKPSLDDLAAKHGL